MGLGRGVSPPTAQIALGEAADALQSLLDQFIDWEIGYKAMGFIPVEQSDGRRFQLCVRDAVPWEDERGFIPLDFAPPAETP